MMLAVEKGVTEPINLGCGKGVTIRELVNIIVENLPHTPRVVWDTSKPSGDRKRLMDITRARSYGFEPQVSFEKGVPAVMKWYMQHRVDAEKRYNIFTQSKYV